jgi:D-glycero-alpha-D-manno-heptose-7-phosphate kinase
LRRELDNFGELLHREWQCKKTLSSRISNSQLDKLYEISLEYGALGGKITGAGGGGYMLLYCPIDKKHPVAEKLKELGCTVVDISLEPMGLQTWKVNNHV